MNMPDPVNTVNGMGQGPAGFGQGAIGSQVGQHQGPGIGIDRAATGGPNMDQTAQAPTGATAPNATATNATSAPLGSPARQSQSFLGFLGGLGSVASLIPGPIGMIGGLVSGIANGVQGTNAKNQANAAAGAATQNQVGIAQDLVNGPNLAPLIKEEQAGMTQAVNNANTANPGKTLLDAFGQAYENAIGGVASGRNQALESASNIYGGVGTSATNASTAIGNPWSSLGTSAAGASSGIGSLFSKGSPSSNPPTPGALSGNEGGLGSSFTGAGVLPASAIAPQDSSRKSGF